MKRSASKPKEAWDLRELDCRPVIVALAGPNGAGKSTFYKTHLNASGLRFLNADSIALELKLDPYRASEVIAKIRAELVQLRESFIFETVFSDPVGDKLLFLKQSAQLGYTVILCFIGIASAGVSESRVAMRVSQGGHDVPSEKLLQRFPRILSNLRRALRELPRVLIFDNDDLNNPFRWIADFQQGKPIQLKQPVPSWLKTVL